MRACVTAIIIVVCSPGGLVHAQSGTDVSPAIPVHPDVSTVLQLPDAVAGVWSIDDGDMMVQGAGSEVYVRPRPGTPAGVEAFVEVKTRTLHRIFLLRVVARAEDARRNVLVPMEAQALGESTPEAPPDEPTEPEAPPLAVTPVAEPTASEFTNTVTSAPPEPTAGPDPAEVSAERNTTAAVAHSTTTAGRPRFDLAVHAVGGLGFTGVKIAGYQSDIALRRHHSLGLRLTGEPRGAWWSLEVDVSGELPTGPMLYREAGSRFEVSGPRLRLDVGMRASLGTRWKASAYAGGGLQVHLRRAEETTNAVESIETMEQGAELALGVGLHYRTRSRVSLGLDFLVRQGGPDDYHSVSALLTVGRLLDQGD